MEAEASEAKAPLPSLILGSSLFGTLGSLLWGLWRLKEASASVAHLQLLLVVGVTCVLRRPRVKAVATMMIVFTVLIEQRRDRFDRSQGKVSL